MDRTLGPTIFRYRGSCQLRSLFHPARRLACLALLALAVPTAISASYFVRNGGDDNADGLSDVTAWASLARVNQQTFAPGDVIQLMRGSTWSGITVAVSSSGAVGNPIVVGAYGSAADPLPVISAPGQTCFQASNHDHITVEDLEFRDARNGLDATNTHYIVARRLKVSNIIQNGIVFKRGGHHTVDACEVNDFGAGGIHFKGSALEPMHDVLVTNCVVRNARPNTHPDGIVIHQSSEPGNPQAGARFILRGNRASNAGEQGFDITTGSDILLEDNVTEDNRAGAITIGHTARRVTVRRHVSHNEPAANTAATLTISGPDVTVEYSVFVGSAVAKKPMVLIKPSVDASTTPPTPEQPENVKLLNNVFIWKNAEPGDLFRLADVSVGQSGSRHTFPATIRSLTVKNNVFASATAATGIVNFPQADRAPDSPGFEIDHNLYYSPAGTRWLVNGVSMDFAKYQQKYSRDLHGLEADPRFVDLAGGDFHLQTGPKPSPAINRGATVSLTQAVDLDHQPVPQGSAAEIGADEIPTSDRVSGSGVRR